MFAILALAVALLSVTVYSSTEVIAAYEKRVLEVMGEYKSVIGPGITFVPPFVSETHSFDLRTEHMRMSDYSALTEDNVSCELRDLHLYASIHDVEEFYKKDFEDLETAAKQPAREAIKEAISGKKADEIDEKYLFKYFHGRADSFADDCIKIESIEFHEPIEFHDGSNFEDTKVERKY